jgi:nucleoside-diphosphate-sugar epimerase
VTLNISERFEYDEVVKTILVLGSAGQIGVPLVSFLRRQGYFVLEYDIASDNRQDLRMWPNSELENLVKESDFIFFLAFDVGGSHYLEKFQSTLDFSENNMRIMANTFHLLEMYKKPFIFTSSQMAYLSHSTYGQLKNLGEQMTHAIGGRVVHLWNVYGFESNPAKFHVISDFVNSARVNGEIRMRTNGAESRDFLYVDDCCLALETAMVKNAELPREMKIHIASSTFTKIIDVANIVASKLNAKLFIGSNLDTIQKNSMNPPDQDFLKFWTPTIKLSEGIDAIIQIWDKSDGKNLAKS